MRTLAPLQPIPRAKRSPDLSVAKAVTPLVACAVIGIGLTLLYQLLDAGELQSFVVGRRRLILMNSIDQFIARRLAASTKPRFTNPNSG
jgi:hypothetical protein